MGVDCVVPLAGRVLLEGVEPPHPVYTGALVCAGAAVLGAAEAAGTWLEGSDPLYPFGAGGSCDDLMLCLN